MPISSINNDLLNSIDVDIVLPNYNSYPFIEETLKSIISKTFNNWKLFIVDGNSNIETHEILKRYQSHPNINIIRLKINKNLEKGDMKKISLKINLNIHIEKLINISV